MEKNTAAQRQAPHYFDPSDPNYYDSLWFRTFVLREVYMEQVRRKVASIIEVPQGLMHEDPDVESLMDDTFVIAQKYLKPDLIASRPTPERRYATCFSFVLTIATHRAITFKTKNPYLWKHGDLYDDVRGKHPVTQDEYLSYEAAEMAELEEQTKEDAAKQRAREVLCPPISAKRFEILWLFAVEELSIRELQALLGKSYKATRMQVYRIVVQAKQILSDPVVRARLLGEEHDKRD